MRKFDEALGLRLCQVQSKAILRLAEVGHLHLQGAGNLLAASQLGLVQQAQQAVVVDLGLGQAARLQLLGVGQGESGCAGSTQLVGDLGTNGGGGGQVVGIGQLDGGQLVNDEGSNLCNMV